MVKFLIDDDIALLTIVVATEDAFSRPYGHCCWSEIVQDLNKSCPRTQGITARAAKERAERLVVQHRAEDNWKKRQ